MRSRYSLSKLLDVQYTRGLSARLPYNSPIVVTSINPGLCVSGLRRELSSPTGIAARVVEAVLARPTAECAKTLVWGTAAGYQDKEVCTTPRGAYTSDFGVCEPSDVLFLEKGKEFEQRTRVRAHWSIRYMPLTHNPQDETGNILIGVDH